jgi:CYTH domain-containing protein
MKPEHKYARVERERRFLLDRFPTVNAVRVRHIADCYIQGTTLRLRKLSEMAARPYSSSPKRSARANGAQEGLITSMYLTEDEFRVLEKISAKKLSKTRHSVPPFGIDVFEGTLEGLVLGEAEFDSAAEAEALTLPWFVGPEVSGDNRFTGGRLVSASREDLQGWLLEYGIRLGSS